LLEIVNDVVTEKKLSFFGCLGSFHKQFLVGSSSPYDANNFSQRLINFVAFFKLIENRAIMRCLPLQTRGSPLKPSDESDKSSNGEAY